ncbi:hypothetical protein CEXT_724351 [Caerostris extrusa]|uniref:Uncharacterized protein n=1 Tax=Caerostris extrusa TaxID=172846 RepID=A0AAV4NAA7_CAEEX|nr:hypothetical protein CEXT_724351 [Caerostris extrusa]
MDGIVICSDYLQSNELQIQNPEAELKLCDSKAIVSGNIIEKEPIGKSLSKISGLQKSSPDPDKLLYFPIK